MEHFKVQPATLAETPTQQQARLRRERREAKIKAGGSARLEKITQLSGRAVELGRPYDQLLPIVQQNPQQADMVPCESTIAEYHPPYSKSRRPYTRPR